MKQFGLTEAEQRYIKELLQEQPMCRAFCPMGYGRISCDDRDAKGLYRCELRRIQELLRDKFDFYDLGGADL